MKALISVYDKTGVVDFATALQALGFDLVSTGGTYRSLAEAGLPVTQVSELTGFPEILDGRVKTLHPSVHAGILARRDLTSHTAQLAESGIDTIDLVAVNLYPFFETVSRPNVTMDEALDNIDIGGPTMVRAAAKNFPHVIVVVDPLDYGWIADRLVQGLALDERKSLSRKAFQHIALYDTAISRYLGDGEACGAPEITLGYTKLYDLRYGENPHQSASLYADVLSSGGVARARQLHGKQLSFNNLLDADAAWRVVSDFEEPAVAIIKHTNPCGLAVHPDQPTAYGLAYEGDSVSAFGGIAGFNRVVTGTTAEAMKDVFYEIVVGPGFEADALEILQKKRNLRIVEVAPSDSDTAGPDVRLITGGALLQGPDDLQEDPTQWSCVTGRQPTEEEREDLAFAWRAAKHIKSNAIVLAKHRAIVGMGAGQPNRVSSVHLALRAAGDRAKGSVLASDAFFPFPDGVEMAAAGGVTAIVQPGGSIRDEEVVAAAQRSGVAMLFTGTRHFKH